MADVGHFGCPKFTFDRISGHLRSICNFIFFWKFLTKWLLAAILDVRNSLSFAFLAISDGSAILDFRNSLSIAILAISDRCRIYFSGGHFGCLKITFHRISGHFRFIRNFLSFSFFLTKWPPAAILDGQTMSIIELVRDIWMSNACVKFEERSLPSKVIALTKL